MKLKKRSETKEISEFKNADLFRPKTDDAENSESETPEDEDETDEGKTPQVHRLNWVTSTNLYDSAILVKEISNFY